MFEKTSIVNIFDNPVGKKITEKAVCGSVFLTIWRSNLSAKLTKTHSFRLHRGRGNGQYSEPINVLSV